MTEFLYALGMLNPQILRIVSKHETRDKTAAMMIVSLALWLVEGDGLLARE